MSSLDLHSCMGNGAGNSSSVSVFTLHQDLLINKDVFSTEGQEDSSSPLAIACKGSRSPLHYKGDAVRLLCPLIRLRLCPILTAISAVIANSLISQTISALAMLPWSSYREIICFSFSSCRFRKHQITFWSVPSTPYPLFMKPAVTDRIMRCVLLVGCFNRQGVLGLRHKLPEQPQPIHLVFPMLQLNKRVIISSFKMLWDVYSVLCYLSTYVTFG